MFGRIRRGRFQLDTYLITLSDNPDNLLDMFSANVLKQPYFKKQKGIHAREIYVVGLAKGYAEGLEVITAIIDDVYQQTGAFDIPGYLKFGRNAPARLWEENNNASWFAIGFKNSRDYPCSLTGNCSCGSSGGAVCAGALCGRCTI